MLENLSRIWTQFSCPAQAGGVDSEVKLYVGKTHTQPLIEDPMSGGRDVLTDEILSVVRSCPALPREIAVRCASLHSAMTFKPLGHVVSLYPCVV